MCKPVHREIDKTIAYGRIYKMKKFKRLNTKLEATGAEFLVLGQLLIRGMQAYKSYVNHPGYDLIVVNPEKKTQARIQVKSRFRTGATGFPINNFESDFVVYVALNRGLTAKHLKKKKKKTNLVKDPEYYIFRTNALKKIARKDTMLGRKVLIKDIRNLKKYKDNWNSIRI